MFGDEIHSKLSRIERISIRGKDRTKGRTMSYAVSAERCGTERENDGIKDI